MKTIFLALLIMLLGFGIAFSQDGAEDNSLSAGGDATAGKKVFLKCQACHNPGAAETHKFGPNLDNIFGRMAATSANYKGYSKALRESAIVWDEAALDQWLRDPQNFLPGNKMPFAGIRSAQDRADLMAYLQDLSKPGQ